MRVLSIKAMSAVFDNLECSNTAVDKPQPGLAKISYVPKPHIH